MTRKKVKLRAMEPEDLDMLYKIENDMSLWKIGTTNVPYSRFALHEYVENCVNDIYIDKQVRFMIDNEEGQTVGIIDLMEFSPQNGRAEVGLIIMNAYRNQGYGSAAVKELIQYAKSIIHLHQLYCIIGVDNQESMELFLREGFIKNASLKEWLFAHGKYEDACVMQLFL